MSEVQSEVQDQQVEAPSLTINDLDAIKNIIDVSCSRGAFKAAEMEIVGKVYNKLAGFLASITASQEDSSKSTETSDQPSEE